MENTTPIEPGESSSWYIKGDNLLPASIVLAAALIAGAWVYTSSVEYRESKVRSDERVLRSTLEEAVMPSDGVELPIAWNDLGITMVRSGVIDKEKFEKLYENRGGLSEGERKLLESAANGNIKITRENSGVLLNLFWALGLGAKNDILEKGPMADARYGGVGRFASTAGWTLAKGNAMDHYSKHSFVRLTQEEQALVERVSRAIYRPCCDNSTYFPDCNHGMAMLGLLELMASQGVSEQDMRKAALAVNSYWFPNEYFTIAAYMKNSGFEWKDMNPEEILGINFSSATGYRKVASQVVEPTGERGGGGCGVDTGGSAAPQREPASPTLQRGGQSGCGI